jgi:hypothetical protein
MWEMLEKVVRHSCSGPEQFVALTRERSSAFVSHFFWLSSHRRSGVAETENEEADL